ncbi:hypothetical protein Fmac_027397 [Flemingia macrophylla]|uniref:Uncharacterized protein n=1 Tax=Flemingia macrophylla TaxID=520843 RepID=A0ABD1LHT5_9FABA
MTDEWQLGQLSNAEDELELSISTPAFTPGRRHHRHLHARPRPPTPNLLATHPQPSSASPRDPPPASSPVPPPTTPSLLREPPRPTPSLLHAPPPPTPSLLHAPPPGHPHLHASHRDPDPSRPGLHHRDPDPPATQPHHRHPDPSQPIVGEEPQPLRRGASRGRRGRIWRGGKQLLEGEKSHANK